MKGKNMNKILKMNPMNSKPSHDTNVLRDKNGIPILGTSGTADNALKQLREENLMLKGMLSEMSAKMQGAVNQVQSLVCIVIRLLEDREPHRTRFDMAEMDRLALEYSENKLTLHTYIDKDTKDLVVYSEKAKPKEKENGQEKDGGK